MSHAFFYSIDEPAMEWSSAQPMLTVYGPMGALLTVLPRPWTPPFVLIPASFIKDSQENTFQSLSRAEVDRLWAFCAEFGQLILRSSVIGETIWQRGTYVNGKPCGRRVGKLFSGGRYFLCRHCYSIAYSSQSEPRYDRALRRANKTRMALGGEPGTANWIAPKPKGMWHRTYERHCEQIERDEGQADHLFLSKFAHLLSREEREMYFREVSD